MYETDSLPLTTRALLAAARHWPPTIRGRARLRLAIRASLHGRKPWLPTKLRDSDLEIIVPWNDTVGSELLAFGDNEPHVHRFIQTCFSATASDRNIFVDIGANVGCFTLRIAERFTNSRAIAFEPNPPIAALLRHNAQITGLSDRIDVREVGAGSASATALLNVHDTDSGNATLRPGTGSDVRVTIRRLDQELTPQQWNRVTVLKIDVEGHELEVLRGASGLFDIDLVPLIFEVNLPELAARDVQPKDLGTLLRGFGYRHFYGCERCLYPIENGAFPVANVVALTEAHRDIVTAFGFDRRFVPREMRELPVVQYQL